MQCDRTACLHTSGSLCICSLHGIHRYILIYYGDADQGLKVMLVGELHWERS
jgi:hypothetical protein